MTTIYLDNAATTPLGAEVWDAMFPFLTEEWGNPSSAHRRGVAAREALDRARGQIARAVGARPQHVTFTGSGTEANNLALLGIARSHGRREGKLWVGPTEHASVREAAEALVRQGFDVERGQLNAEGQLDLDRLQEVTSEETLLATQMLVSNEFGSIYPTAEAGRRLKSIAPRAWLHVDAIQALGKLPISLEELGADSLSLSGHKIHGPQGVGALVCARDVELEPIVYGGGQEAGLRSGTQNLAGIVGFGCAVELADERQVATLDTLRQRRAEFIAGLERLSGVECFQPGPAELQQPGILSLVMPGAPAEVWLHHLDSQGVVVSVGSACQASKREISPVMSAAGIDVRRARQILRLSFCGDTSADELQRAIQTFEHVAQELAQL